jgi:hypothetical protein
MRDEYLKKMLFEIPKHRKNSFVFTLDASADDQEESIIDNYFNCICVKFETLKQRKRDK